MFPADKSEGALEALEPKQQQVVDRKPSRPSRGPGSLHYQATHWLTLASTLPQPLLPEPQPSFSAEDQFDTSSDTLTNNSTMPVPNDNQSATTARSTTARGRSKLSVFDPFTAEGDTSPLNIYEKRELLAAFDMRKSRLEPIFITEASSLRLDQYIDTETIWQNLLYKIQHTLPSAYRQLEGNMAILRETLQERAVNSDSPIWLQRVFEPVVPSLEELPEFDEDDDARIVGMYHELLRYYWYQVYFALLKIVGKHRSITFLQEQHETLVASDGENNLASADDPARPKMHESTAYSFHPSYKSVVICTEASPLSRVEKQLLFAHYSPKNIQRRVWLRIALDISRDQDFIEREPTLEEMRRILLALFQGYGPDSEMLTERTSLRYSALLGSDATMPTKERDSCVRTEEQKEQVLKLFLSVSKEFWLDACQKLRYFPQGGRGGKRISDRNLWMQISERNWKKSTNDGQSFPALNREDWVFMVDGPGGEGRNEMGGKTGMKDEVGGT